MESRLSSKSTATTVYHISTGRYSPLTKSWNGGFCYELNPFYQMYTFMYDTIQLNYFGSVPVACMYAYFVCQVLYKIGKPYNFSPFTTATAQFFFWELTLRTQHTFVSIIIHKFRHKATITNYYCSSHISRISNRPIISTVFIQVEAIYLLESNFLNLVLESF